MQKLNCAHVCFADDLLLFCRVDLISVKILKDAFTTFSEASVLQANSSKSAVYIDGVHHSINEQILEELGFTESKLPLRYLGVPLDSKKFAACHYLPVSEKITAKVTCWSAKFLSYASRCQLIKAVIFGIQSYWAQIFILPKTILKAVENICRTFLWTGNGILSRKAPMAWDKVCRPIAAGGLNIIDMTIWNKAAISKHLWYLASKKDCLWI